MKKLCDFLGRVFLLAALLTGCSNLEMSSSGGQPNDSSGMVKVTFDPNGGDWTGISVYSWEIVSTIPKNSSIVFPARHPAYRNGVLAGWYKNAMPPIEPDAAEPAGRLLDGTLVQNDMTVYALWRLKPIDSYIITFKQYEDDTNSVFLFALKENGYKLNASGFPALNERQNWDAVTGEGVWWTAPEGGTKFDENTVVTEDITVYGHWSGKKRKLFFNTNGGVWSDSANAGDFTHFPAELPYAPADEDALPYIQIQYPVRIIPSIPASRPVKKDGNDRNMMFLGWTTDFSPAYRELDAEAQTNFITFLNPVSQIDDDTTVYAVWKCMLDNQMEIVFHHYNGLTEAGAADFDGQTGFLAESNFPNEPERTGYDFSGWYLSPSGGTAFTASYAIPFGAENPAGAGSFNVYALWSPQHYTVTYLLNYDDAGEYSVENTPGIAVFPADSVTLPAPPARPGWVFYQWNRLAGGSGPCFDGTGIDSDMNVYAIWSIMPSSEMLSPYDDGGRIQTIMIPETGWYRIELWGAKGNDVLSPLNTKGFGGKGAYTKGNIYLEANEELFLMIGGYKPGSTGGFNGGGGGRGGRGGGGGATDIRLLNNMDSVGLASRIMVAGGGGGASDARYSSGSAEGSGPNLRYNGGAGGTIAGFDAEGDDFGKGGTQTAGGGTSVGSYAQHGLFGKGGTPRDNTLEMIGGGGGGWWGGGSGGRHSSNGGGGGGSSFISGFPGCVATAAQFGFNAAAGEEGSIEKATSWTGKVFTHAVMRSGNETMPAPGGGLQTGHNSSGYGRITYIGPENEQ